MVTAKTTATEVAALAASGVAATHLGVGYWQLAIAGLLIGFLHWYHGLANAEPEWTKHQSISEALMSAVFGLLAMPASMDLASPVLVKHGIDTPAINMLIGGVAAFVIVELVRIGLKYLNTKATS